MFAKQVLAAVFLGTPIMLCNARPLFPISAAPETITVTLPFSIPTGLPFNISLPTGLPFNISLPTLPPIPGPFPILTAASPVATGQIASVGTNDVINGFNQVNALVRGAQSSIVGPLSNNVNLMRNTVIPSGTPPNLTTLVSQIETLIGTGLTDLTSTINEIATEIEQLGGLAANITGIPSLPTILQTTLGGMTSLANSITQVVGNVQSAVPGSALNNLDSTLFSNLQQAVQSLASGSSNAITNLQNVVPTHAGQQAVAAAWSHASGALSGSIRQLNNN